MPNASAIETLDTCRAAPVEAPLYGPGTLIAGKYRIEEALGVGGMGTVYRAHNLILDVPVALKLILPEIRAQDMIDRLLTEARVEAKLEHPSIVRVFDFGETQHGDPYIVMELLSGRSFGEVLEEQRPMDPKLTVQILLPVIAALDCAHQQGVVHRDLKPDNIFLTRSGAQTRPKLLDFGIAKLLEAPARVVTQGGTVLGSPAYMSPEQARGLQDVDHRADIWSVCVVLYEALTGHAPFRGTSYQQILRAVVITEPAVPGGSSTAELALWQILQRGLIKSREQRFQSMNELGDALAGWLVAQGVHEDICGDPLTRHWKPGELATLGSPMEQAETAKLRPHVQLHPELHDVPAAANGAVLPMSAPAIKTPARASAAVTARRAFQARRQASLTRSGRRRRHVLYQDTRASHPLFRNLAIDTGASSAAMEVALRPRPSLARRATFTLAACLLILFVTKPVHDDGVEVDDVAVDVPVHVVRPAPPPLVALEASKAASAPSAASAPKQQAPQPQRATQAAREPGTPVVPSELPAELPSELQDAKLMAAAPVSAHTSISRSSKERSERHDRARRADETERDSENDLDLKAPY